MKLIDYMQNNGLNASAFASKVGVPASTIFRLLKGDRNPGLDLLEKIAKTTEGAVMPNDFLSDETKELLK